MRQRNLNLWTASYGMTLGLVMAAFGGQMASAQGLSYQKASDITPNIFPSTAFTTTNVDNDNLWGLRTDFGSQGSFGTPEVWQAGVTEDVPELRQLVSGLTPNTEYDLYATFWTDDDENWTIRAGTTSGNLTQYSFYGDHRTPVEGSTVGLTAGAAIWDSPPPPTKAGTIYTEPRVTDPVQPFDDPLVMVLGYAGRVTSNGAGEIDVFVDDLPQAGAARRTWFDGVAYRPASDTPLALTASVNRDTGAITVNNETGTNFQITSYTVDSINGGLDATAWSTINDGDPTWTIVEPADPANTPYATILNEDGGNNFMIAASGGSLDVGDVWINSPFEDVRIYLTLADGSLAVLAPEYTGGETILTGDFNADGAIDLNDYEILLSSMHTTVMGTNVERHEQGDMTVNGAVDFLDFQAFRTAFDAANGAGAFAQMAAQVPEPGTAAMLLILGAVAAVYARRRRFSHGLALMMCCLLASTASAQLLRVDVDARAGDSTAGPPGPNTVDGFSSYTMEAGTTGALGTSTGTVDGYTITLTAVDAAGNPAGGFDDRDRAQPTTTPTLNQLYDDFIFANVTTTGEGGGLDMMIDSGGALMPNTSYFFTLYAWDVSSTGVRSADWLDGNAANAVAFSTSFDGSNAPSSDEQYRFVGNVQTDGSGNLLLRARETAPASHGVFINGFEISDEPPPAPIELTLEINTTTGATRIVNNQEVSFDVSYYEIRSTAGALNVTGWTSFDDGEGGAGGAGDYNGNGTVDAADYTLWRDTEGQSVTPGTGADGDNDGTIGPGDYTVWVDNFGNTGGSDPIGTGWDEVPSSTANILSELNLQSMDTFDADDSASLGNAFSVGGTEDIQFFYAGPSDGGLRLGLVEYVTSGSGASAAVPEPATLSLWGLAAALLGAGILRRR